MFLWGGDYHPNLFAATPGNMKICTTHYLCITNNFRFVTGNAVGDEGATALACGLERNTTLETLDLGMLFVRGATHPVTYSVF